MVIAFYKEFLVLSFDPVLAITLRLPARFLENLLLILIAVTISSIPPNCGDRFDGRDAGHPCRHSSAAHPAGAYNDDPGCCYRDDIRRDWAVSFILHRDRFRFSYRAHLHSDLYAGVGRTIDPGLGEKVRGDCMGLAKQVWPGPVSIL